MGRLVALIGVVLLLSGCTKEIRFAMLGAPISYAVSLVALYDICRAWRSPERDILMRPVVLAGPAVLLLLSSLLYIDKLVQPSRSNAVFDPFSAVLILAIWMALPLFLINGLIWRIWILASPRTSFEGSALVSAALFFTPGVLLSHKLITDPQTADTLAGLMFVFSLYYGAIGGMILLVLLRLEAMLKGRR